ncbi:TPA: branched-chain amino acid ABC transporter permease, partial [Candidatus Micrarchaeota archaeon]|nr:branched-chain amino acid ABC transporter permease [Candidatus Micrarchaeota archaeon]
LLAGALAGLAGAFMALWYVGNTWVGSNRLPSIFAASILGGLSSIYGAVAGGLIMGLAEVLGTVALAHTVGTWIAPYRPLIPLAVMATMLLVAPQGIAGLWSSFSVVKRRGSAA